jgi:hypothetical protein
MAGEKINLPPFINEQSLSKPIMKLYPILLFLLVIVSHSASAMTVSLADEEDVQFVSLSGKIMPGDAERIAKIVIDFKKRTGYLIKAFRVDSAGGDINEALKIAALVRGLYGSVKVINDRYCASSLSDFLE